MAANSTLQRNITGGASPDMDERQGDQTPVKGIIVEDLMAHGIEELIVMLMLAAMALVGTMGNAVAIYVFNRLKRKMLTSTFFILTLAYTDFITCLITIPFTILVEYRRYNIYNDVLCKSFHFLKTTTVPFSCVVIVAIAIDRYLCICHPFHRYMNIRRARIIVLIMGLCIFINGGVIAAHYKHTVLVNNSFFQNPNVSTSLPETGELEERGVASKFNSTSSRGSIFVSPAQYPSFIASPFFSEPNHSTESEKSIVFVNQTGRVYTPPTNVGRGHVRDSTAHGGKSEEIPVAESTAAANTIILCLKDRGTIDEKFFRYFRLVYQNIFSASCIIVFVLYILIYRSLVVQRKQGLCIKSVRCCLFGDSTRENARSPGAFDTRHVLGTSPLRVTSTTRKNSIGPIYLKTAGTLFIVTIVFIIAFLPAWLMSINLIKFNIFVFCLKFIYHVGNPFIYAFRDQNFKTEIKRVFYCRAY
ncbi:cholecystokinin receptor type A [Elysia marginata]|uniref:Cholecystokinin receptor type A n=1 Tax=Elysia marginata TaxID=1093978 RepID=A0AAV4IV30_9GAST|nr:cholecystokinin receptor type A [Elysia marginata]